MQTATSPRDEVMSPSPSLISVTEYETYDDDFPSKGGGSIAEQMSADASDPVRVGMLLLDKERLQKAAGRVVQDQLLLWRKAGGLVEDLSVTHAAAYHVAEENSHDHLTVRHKFGAKEDSTEITPEAVESWKKSEKIARAGLLEDSLNLHCIGRPLGAKGLTFVLKKLLQLRSSDKPTTTNEDKITEYKNNDLVKYVKHFRSVHTVNCSASVICDDGLRALGNVLNHFAPRLHKLDLSANNLGPVTSHIISQSRICSTLASLNLDHNHIGDEGCMNIALSMFRGQMPKLIDLSLSQNRISDTGFSILVSALRTADCKLAKLDISTNDVTNHGVILLSFALGYTMNPPDPAVEEKSEEQLAEEAALAAAEAAKKVGKGGKAPPALDKNKKAADPKTKTEQEVAQDEEAARAEEEARKMEEYGLLPHLEECSPQIIALFKSLPPELRKTFPNQPSSEPEKINTTLTHIDLTANAIGVLGAQCLVNAIRVQQSLISLHLEGNSLRVREAASVLPQLSKALQRNVQKKKLDIQRVFMLGLHPRVGVHSGTQHLLDSAFPGAKEKCIKEVWRFL